MTATTSYSGCHPYRPRCVIDQLRVDLEEEFDEQDAVLLVAEFTKQIDAGACPRCYGSLPDGKPVRPAGSRATPCRCVPVCGPCGEDEVFHPESPYLWPLMGVRDRVAACRSRLRPAVLGLSAPGWKAERCGADSTPSARGGLVVMTEDGVAEVKGRPHPGGWLEFGFDDDADQAEVAR